MARFSPTNTDNPADAQTHAAPDSVRDLIVAFLRSGNCKARFISELYAALEKSKVSAAVAEQELAALETAGTVILRDHFCADPHLAAADLRVVTIVAAAADEDPELAAIGRIEETWNTWLTEYLANHRCG